MSKKKKGKKSKNSTKNKLKIINIVCIIVFIIHILFLTVFKNIVPIWIHNMKIYVFVILSIIQFTILLITFFRRTSKKQIKKVLIIIVILYFVSLVAAYFVGYYIYLEGNTNSDKYAIEKVMVTDIVDGKLAIDVGSKGDTKRNYINKPIFPVVNIGEYIFIKYEKSDKSNMHYIIDPQVGKDIYSGAINVLTYGTLGIIATFTVPGAFIYYAYYWNDEEDK